MQRSLTFLSGFAISGNILQNGFITSRNLTASRMITLINHTFITQHSILEQIREMANTCPLF